MALRPIEDYLFDVDQDVQQAGKPPLTPQQLKGLYQVFERARSGGPLDEQEAMQLAQGQRQTAPPMGRPQLLPAQGVPPVLQEGGLINDSSGQATAQLRSQMLRRRMPVVRPEDMMLGAR